MHTPRFLGNDRLAITGMALVNALGNTVSEVWENSRAMHSGLSTLRPLTDDPPHFITTDDFVPGVQSYCSVIAHANLACTRHDIDLPPQDFRAMSISSRLTLLMAKQAIAASGLAQGSYAPERVGVFVSQNSGEAASTLWDVNLTLRAHWLTDLAASVGNWSTEQKNNFYQRIMQGRVSPDESTMLCRLNCTAAGSICQRHGFAGPSYSVGAACSSSMAALYTAFTLIQAGAIDAAVVGGAEEGYSPLYFAEFSALGALARPSAHSTSPDSYSRPFDLHRNGFVLGEGAGMIVLERESCARTRNAPIHGLLTAMGASTNSVGLIEPSASAQADAIRQSFSRVDYGPEAVDLVECHATATPQGDLAEAQSLAMCFGHKSAPTILSGYKGQIGHTTGASGIISLIHGLCAMRDKVFPGTRNCETPDPALGLDAAKLRVLSAPDAWDSPSTGIRRMQINTFGFGGSCFVAQVEEPNDRQPASVSIPASIGNADSITPAFQGQEAVVDGTRMITLPHEGQVWRLGSTTPAWLNELAGLASQPSPAELSALGRRGLWLSPPVAAPAVAMMCCGQGSVWPGMGRALYDTFPAAREAMDRIAKVADWDILGLMNEPSLDKIILTRWQQPYLFLLEYAQAHYLKTLGLKPTVMSGHSLGELIALCLAGVYSPETAWTILDTRSRFMAQLEAEATNETGMMSVHCTPEVLDATLKEWPELHVSNYNSPMQVILSGPRELLQEVRRTLRKRRIPAILLNVSLAFHHPHMRALRDQSVTRLLKLDFHAPRLPMMSNITTGLYPDTKEAIVSYIADLDENSVRWVECVRNMWNTYSIRHFVEVGPGDTLCGLVSDIEAQAVCVAAGRKDKEVEAMRNAVARLYALGHLPMRAGRGGNKAAPSQARGQAPVAMSPAVDTADRARPTEAPSQHAAPYEAHIEKVMPIIAQATGYTREELQADMDLRHDLAIRSSRFPLIMHEAEQQFQIKLRFEDMLGVATIRDLADVLRKLQDAAQGQKSAAAVNANRQTRDKNLVPSLLPVMRYRPWLCPVSASPVAATMPSQAQQPMAVQYIIVAGPACAQVAEALAAYYSPAQIHQCPTFSEARNLCTQAVNAAPALSRGLVLALPAYDATASLSPDANLLTDAFMLVKDFCASLHAPTGEKGTGFCMAVQEEAAALNGPSALESDPLFAGLCGILLACALEYPACLCRTVRLHGTVTAPWIPHALHAPAKGEASPVQWLFTGDAAHSVQPVPCALNPEITPQTLPVRHGDIILVPGGGRGISPYALAALAPLECTFILLGRSAKNTGANNAAGVSDIADASASMGVAGLNQPASDALPDQLAQLTHLGSTIVHMACDVTDATAVQQVVQTIVQQWGRIDGLIHAAGVTHDATMDTLDADTFSAVVRIKYQGLWACLEACRPAGLRYAVAFSSMAAWLGNYGQSNYCAANRAMTTLLHSYAALYGIASRALWLPPVLGAGMAAHSDMQAQLRLRGLDNAWLYCEELGDMLARDLFCGSDADCIWARVLPALPSVLPPSPLSHSAQVGQYEHCGLFPLVFPVEISFTQDAPPHRSPPAQARFVGGHDFSRYADPWLTPLAPRSQVAADAAPEGTALASAPVSMVVACLVEAAAQTCPWLSPAGVYALSVQQLPLCSGGTTREARIDSNALPWECKSASIQRSCLTSMRQISLSANGRRQARWETIAEGRVPLATLPPVQLAPLGAQEHTDGQLSKGHVPATGTRSEHAWDTVPLPATSATPASHIFPAPWLEACVQGALRTHCGEDTACARLIRIAAIEWLLPKGEAPAQLFVNLRPATAPTSGDDTWSADEWAFDAHITDAQGALWMCARTMVFTDAG